MIVKFDSGGFMFESRDDKLNGNDVLLKDDL
jgi:hypothetical protein